MYPATHFSQQRFPPLGLPFKPRVWSPESADGSIANHQEQMIDVVGRAVRLAPRSE
jgi:hypothetical protein